MAIRPEDVGYLGGVTVRYANLVQAVLSNGARRKKEI